MGISQHLSRAKRCKHQTPGVQQPTCGHQLMHAPIGPHLYKAQPAAQRRDLETMHRQVTGPAAAAGTAGARRLQRGMAGAQHVHEAGIRTQVLSPL